MKKIAILIFLLFIIPFRVLAATASVSDINISGVNSVNVGSSFYESFYVKFSDIKKGTLDTLGLWIVGFELEYNENDFVIDSVDKNGHIWDTIIYKQDGKTYVLSTFLNNADQNGCVDKVLYCADYLVTIKFYVKDTNNTSSEIKMKNVTVGAFPVQGGMNPQYDTKDMIKFGYAYDLSYRLDINKPENIKVEEPISIVSDKKPEMNNTVTRTTPTTRNVSNDKPSEAKKSHNNLLESLEIKDYPFDFSKEILDYEITIKKGINELEVTAKPEDSKASFEIVGADDLKKNGYKILVKVKSESEREKIYTIKVNHLQETKKDEANESKSILESKKFKIAIIIVGIIMLLALIIIIINAISNRKLEKKLNF